MPHVREATGAPPRVSGGDSVLPESERRLILRGVSWAAYDRLLTDMTDSHAAHLAYDRGVLEIMVLSVAHERLNRRLAALFEALAEGSGIDCENLGSASLIHQDAARGCEPDSCFYVRDAERIRATEAIDLAVDPPPDLIVEVDLTSHSLDKLPIYAGIGVSEVWRYAAGTLTLLILDEGGVRGVRRERRASPRDARGPAAFSRGRRSDEAGRLAAPRAGVGAGSEQGRLMARPPSRWKEDVPSRHRGQRIRAASTKASRRRRCSSRMAWRQRAAARS